MATTFTINVTDTQLQYATYAWQVAVSNKETIAKTVEEYLHNVFQISFDGASNDWANLVVTKQLEPVAAEIKKDPSLIDDVTAAAGIEVAQPLP